MFVVYMRSPDTSSRSGVYDFMFVAYNTSSIANLKP